MYGQPYAQQQQPAPPLYRQNVYPPADARLDLWDQIALRLVEHELRSNPWVDPSVFIGDENNPVGLEVLTTWGPEDYDCRMTFTIETKLHYKFPDIRPLPGVSFTMDELRKGEILCK